MNVIAWIDRDRVISIYQCGVTARTSSEMVAQIARRRSSVATVGRPRPCYDVGMAASETFDIRTTSRVETIDVTSLVRAAIRKSGVDGGLCCVFCPHTTAGLTIQENSNPQVKAALNEHLARTVPHDATEVTTENNQDAHVKASLIGTQVTLIVEGGKPLIGTWQAIYFCEYDGPRSRRLHVKVVAG
jgi:secondary thiamine-phosphate synthase enzyme